MAKRKSTTIDYRTSEEYRAFAAAYWLKSACARGQAVTIEQTREAIDAFYTAVFHYPEYAATLTRGSFDDKHPDYSYAYRQTGVFPDWIHQLEQLYLLRGGK